MPARGLLLPRPSEDAWPNNRGISYGERGFIGSTEAKCAENVAKAVESEAANAAKGSTNAVLTESQVLRIQNAATRINKPINVVGSRASGTAKLTSDWDYVIQGMTNKEWKMIKNSLPGAPSRVDGLPRMIDVFKGSLDPTKPYITIYPW